MKKKNIKEFALITIGILLVAISVVYFFEPNNIAAGGITGLAIVINHYIPFISTNNGIYCLNVLQYSQVVNIWRYYETNWVNNYRL